MSRVCVVLPSLFLGGAERQALAFASFLGETAGHEVTALAWGPWGSARTFALSRSVNVHVVGAAQPSGRGMRLLRPANALARVLRFLRADVVFSYCYHANILTGLAAWQNPRSVCIWGQRDEGFGLTPTPFERIALRRFRAAVANGPGSQMYAQQVLRFAHRATVLAPNACVKAAPARSRRDWRGELCRTQDEVLVCMLANLSERKDHATLLRAWGEIHRNMPKARARLVLAGDVQPGSRVPSMVREMGLSDDVVMTGHVQDVAGLLHAVDVAVQASHSEGCSNALLEGMMAGLPNVATDIPANRSVFPDGHGEWLLPHGDAQALAASLCRLICSAPLRVQLGQQARAWALAHFSEDAAFRRLLDNLGKIGLRL